MKNNNEIAVVMITHNRRERTLDTLRHLAGLSERPPNIVVDNGSTDGTADAIRTSFPGVRVIALEENLGSAGRNIGVREAGTPLVAFADDDSWWEPGALSCAVATFERCPNLAVLAARVLVGPENRLDPSCAEMSECPLPGDPRLPGPPVLGFVACGAVVRVEPFLAAGGFHPRFGVGGEEELLALDLADAHQSIAYVDSIIAHHHPAVARDPQRRRRVQTRNALWTTWLRRPLTVAASRTVRLGMQSLGDREARAALIDAARGIPWVLRERESISSQLEAQVRLLESKTVDFPGGKSQTEVHAQ